MIPHAYVNIYINDPTGNLPPSTEIVRYDDFVRGLIKPQTEQLMKLHCALGVAGEAGELADNVKRECIYGKPADRANVIEELGDIMWYVQATMNLYGILPGDVFQGNADKLSKRYVELKYSDKAAIDRADKKIG